MKRYMRSALLLGLILAVQLCVSADVTIPIATEQRVAANQSVNLYFNMQDPVPQGQQARLVMKARLETTSLGGSADVMQILVNNNVIVSSALLNKLLDFTTLDGLDATGAPQPHGDGVSCTHRILTRNPYGRFGVRMLYRMRTRMLTNSCGI